MTGAGIAATIPLPIQAICAAAKPGRNKARDLPWFFRRSVAECRGRP
jgi:hypothetical protein